MRKWLLGFAICFLIFAESLFGAANPAGPAGTARWGSISGDINDQNDLMTKLDVKQVDIPVTDNCSISISQTGHTFVFNAVTDKAVTFPQAGATAWEVPIADINSVGNVIAMPYFGDFLEIFTGTVEAPNVGWQSDGGTYSKGLFVHYANDMNRVFMDANYGPWRKATTQILRIDHTKVAGDEVNFPALIDGNVVGAGFWSAVEANGSDIYLRQNGTELKRYMVSLDKTAHTIELWVRMPTVSASTDTNAILYYGTNLGKSNDFNVWDSNYAIVQHFGGGTDADMNILDSTVWANNLTPANAYGWKFTYPDACSFPDANYSVRNVVWDSQRRQNSGGA